MSSMQSGKDFLDRCVLRRRRNVVNDSADVTSSGRSFHVCGQATGKARLPTVDTLLIGTTRRSVPTDLSDRRLLTRSHGSAVVTYWLHELLRRTEQRVWGDSQSTADQRAVPRKKHCMRSSGRCADVGFVVTRIARPIFLPYSFVDDSLRLAQQISVCLLDLSCWRINNSGVSTLPKRQEKLTNLWQYHDGGELERSVNTEQFNLHNVLCCIGLRFRRLLKTRVVFHY